MNSQASSNRPPVLINIPTVRTHVGGAVYFQAEAIDPEGDPITFSASNLPEGATLSSDGIFAWIPEGEGSYTVIIHAGDGTTYDSQNVYINVGLYPDLQFENLIIPPCGSRDNITGTVTGYDDLTDFRVFCYIYISGYGWGNPDRTAPSRRYRSRPMAPLKSILPLRIWIYSLPSCIWASAIKMLTSQCCKTVAVFLISMRSIPKKRYRDPTEGHNTLSWSGPFMVAQKQPGIFPWAGRQCLFRFGRKRVC